MVYGFAKQSDGAVTVESEPGRGTTVRIFLLRSTAPAQSAPQAEATVLGAAPGPQSARILVVDDDAAVRDLTSTALRDAGYEISEAADGQAALLSLSQAGPPAFDLLIADYAMPGMNGMEMVSRARQLQPDLKVLFVTGYVDAEALSQIPKSDIVLRKPFRLSELVQAVAAQLADGAAKRRGNVIPMTGGRKA
jgi:CheY-like chemotaxis protein